MLGGHAMTAIAAITAQNTLGVQGVHAVPTEMVLMQIDSVVADIGVDAVKIGMIGSAETAAAVAERLRILVELHDASVAVRSVANPELLRERGVRRSGDYAMPQRRLSLPIVFDKT